MKLYLFRHGLAVDREEFARTRQPDALRPLTGKGREKSARMAAHLAERTGGIEILVTSPLVRARQTAETVSGILSFGGFLEATELVPEAPPQAFARWLQVHAPRASSVMAVGHEPQLGTFASWLVAGSIEPFLEMKKSGVLLLEVESFDNLGPRSAELKWILTPKMIG